MNTNKTARTRKNVPTSVNITVDTLPVNVPSAFTLNPVLMEQQEFYYAKGNCLIQQIEENYVIAEVFPDNQSKDSSDNSQDNEDKHDE